MSLLDRIDDLVSGGQESRGSDPIDESRSTDRQKVMKLAKRHGIEVEVEKNSWDAREVIRVEFIAPDGKGFDYGTRHTTVFVPSGHGVDWSEALEDLTWAIEDMTDLDM